MVVQLTSGPCVALEVMDINDPECSQANFRKLAGPTDPVCWHSILFKHF